MILTHVHLILSAAFLTGGAAVICAMYTQAEQPDSHERQRILDQPVRDEVPPIVVSLPEVWTEPSTLEFDRDIFGISIKGTPALRAETRRIHEVITRELMRYPAGVLTAHEDKLTTLSAVSVHRDVCVNGGRAGGTYIPYGLVFLAAGTQASYGPRWEEYLVRALHHEISSVLLHRSWMAFDEKAFQDQLPAGFVYEDDRPGANTFDIHQDKKGVESIEDLADGFLADYASRNMEQDFNTYAELLMWRPELLDQFAPDSRVGKKAAIVRQFYYNLSPEFATVLSAKNE